MMCAAGFEGMMYIRDHLGSICFVHSSKLMHTSVAPEFFDLVISKGKRVKKNSSLLLYRTKTKVFYIVLRMKYFKASSPTNHFLAQIDKRKYSYDIYTMYNYAAGALFLPLLNLVILFPS
jgi:hypothetical protein